MGIIENFLSNFKNKFCIAILIAISLVTIGCQDTSFKVEPKPKLTVAIDATFIPMSFVNDQDQLTGFEVDLIKAVIDEAGYEYELINVEWGGLFGGLISKKFDLLISSITILPERKERMAFSIPYLQSGVALLARKDLKDINSLEDIKKHQGIVGAQMNTTSYFYLEKFSSIEKKGYDKFAHAVLDLTNGGLIAVLGDTAQINYFHKENKELNEKTKIVGQRLTSEDYGIVFRKDSSELIKNINLALTNLLINGTVKKLHNKWNLGNFSTVPTPQ
ncbi:MAG: transporter substrate-binding domain-containing protein [Nitrospinales bacterium]